MSSFRIVDTRFRILKGGKIGLAASIALIGGMLTLGSTSANAVGYNVGHDYDPTIGTDYVAPNGETSNISNTNTSITVSSTQNSVALSSSNTFTNLDPTAISGTTNYNGTININAGQNLTGENGLAVYSSDISHGPAGLTSTYTSTNIEGATLNLAGNNTITGDIGINIETSVGGDGGDFPYYYYNSNEIAPLQTINIATGTVTFNDNVYSDRIEINSGANVNFYGDIDNDDNSSVIDYNGHNATVTLNDGSDLSGSIVKSAASTNGTLIFEGNSTITGSVADGSSTIGLVSVRGENKTVTIGGNLSTDHLDYQAASTVTVGGDLILDVDEALDSINKVTFGSHDGILNIGGDIVGVEGQNTITTTGISKGTVTMLGGNQEITGNIGTSTNKIKTLNIGDTDGEDASSTIVNGDIFATTTSLNNKYDIIAVDSTLTMASGYNITSNIETNENGMGILNLEGGTQTVDGTVGTTGMRLNEVNSGEASANSTFTGNVFTDNANVSTGTTTFESNLTVTDILTSTGTLTVEGTTLVDGVNGQIDINAGTSTFEGIVTVSGLGADIFVDDAIANFESNVTVDDLISATNSATVNMGIEESSIIVSAGNITIDDSTLTAYANITVANDMTVTNDSLVEITGDLELEGEDSTLTISSSDFTITGDVLLSSLTYEDVGTFDSPTSIVINDSNATFNGTVTVSSEAGNLNIADTTVASNVKFNGIVDIGNNISIDNNIVGEDAYSLVSEPTNFNNENINVYTPNPLATKVEFNANVTAGNDLTIDNSVVNFGNLASGEIDENAVVATIENNLNLTNSYVTLNGDLNVTNDMNIENSYGHFTASGEDASVTVGDTLTIDDLNTTKEVSFITFDSKVNVGEDFIVLGNDNINNSFFPQGEITTVILNDNVTVGNNLSIDEAFVSLSGTSGIALDVGNDVTIGEDSFVQITGGNIDIDGNMTLQESSDLYVGLPYYNLMIDMYSDGILDGDYLTETTTEITIGENLLINDSFAWLGNEAINGEDDIVSIAKNTVNVVVAGNATIEDGSDVQMVGDLELTGATSTLTISESEFDIIGNTLLNGEGATSIVIDDSNTTFDGTVTVLSTTGNLNVTDTTGASNVTFEDTVTVGNAIAVTGFGVNKDTTLTFNGDVTATDITFEDATVYMGTGEDSITVLAEDELNIFDSTLTAYADITVENDMDISGSEVTITGNTDVTDTLTISDSSVASDVEFNGEVVANSITVNGVNGNKDTDVIFNGLVSTTGGVYIEDATVAFNDTLDVGDTLDIADSTVTFEKAVTIDGESNIYSYDSFSIVHFKDTLTAYDDIFVYGNTTLTLDKGLNITTGEDSYGTLHLDSDNVTVNAKDHVFANVEFDDDAVLNVSDTKNIYGTVRTTDDDYGILNFLGTTTLQGDIGEDGVQLYRVRFAATGEDAGSFTQNIGHNIYSYNTYIGNGYNQVRANITNDITFGGDLDVRSGSTLNVSDKDIIVEDTLTLDSGSTTNFKVYTTDITSGQAVENANSGSISTDYLSLSDDTKFNITYDGSWYGAGKYNLITVNEEFYSGEDYLGTEANGLVTDNSIIDSVIKRFVDEEGNEFLSLYADRTGDNSYDAKDLYIEKSEIGNNYSNGASQSLAGYADGTKREGALADIIRQMEDLEDGITISAEKKQEMQEMQKLLAPTANNSAISSSLSATNLGLGTIAGRIADVRGAGAGGNILAFNDGAMTGLSAGEETLDSSFWIKAIGSTASQDKVDQYDGYKSDTYGIVAGVDKTLKNGTTIGFALAYADTSTKQKDLRNGDDSDTNTIQATAYASKEFGNLYVDGMLSYANHSTDAVRTANSGKLTSDIKADQLAAKVETGYRFVLDGTTTLTPFASLEYSMLDQKAYTEKGTVYQNDALRVDSTKLNKGTVGLGTKLATNVKAGDMTLIPELTVGLYNSFGDDSTDIKAQFVGGGNQFVTPTQELNETMINIGAGVKMSLSDTSSLILDIDHDRSSNGDFEGYSGSVSYRLNF